MDVRFVILEIVPVKVAILLLLLGTHPLDPAAGAVCVAVNGQAKLSLKLVYPSGTRIV